MTTTETWTSDRPQIWRGPEGDVDVVLRRTRMCRPLGTSGMAFLRIASDVFDRYRIANEPDSSGVDFYKVDVDAQNDIAQEAAGIKAMPTFTVVWSSLLVRRFRRVPVCRGSGEDVPPWRRA
ncbi:thioredoxin family protein [Streptomyces sp. AD681]|uniref:thioredoxin family protein n=1 Tax=Streptomyces sp. AD681 TaxID=3019069 RepID=UPI0022F15553|nr:thioredoxin family protein [Streptomyces sp. AD681]MDA5142826.1 thioredoxin family protein [Streptomyces sp. AD681]